MKNFTYNTNNIFTEYPNIVSRKDMQTMLNIGNNTAYHLLNTGEISSIRIGRVHKIPKVNIIAYLNKQALQNNSDVLQYKADTVGGFKEVTAND